MSSYPERARLRAQTVLYHSHPERVSRALMHLKNAVEWARRENIVSSVEVALGDGSPTPVFNQEQLELLQEGLRPHLDLKYVFFGKNLGTARGHNTLFEGSDAEFVVVMNPDVVMAPNALVELFQPFHQKMTGMVEARQIPIEHPKEYDTNTGETSWASTACCLIPAGVWRDLNGFDAESFFLYCDDVDFSWRVRLLGLKVIFQPSAMVFHDKRLTATGEWQSTSAERYFSAEAALILAHKYSRPDLVKKISDDFHQSPEEHFQRALQTFNDRMRKGHLCNPIDPQHQVAEFIQGAYAKHRYTL